MAALPNLITVEEFRALPESGEFAYELHHGEVVAMTRPRSGHSGIQRRLLLILEQKASNFGLAFIELPYRPVAEFDLRVADVALVSRERWDRLDPEADLFGAPELVVEVKSPSNTRRQLQDTVSMCLGNGALECWIVDRPDRSVTVTHRDGSTTLYTSGDVVPLTAFGGDGIAVDEIFA